MIAVIVIICIIALLVIISFGVILYKSVFKDDDDEYMDYTIIENYMPQYTDGYSEGILMDVISGPERKGFIFIPRDEDYLRKLKKDKNLIIKPQIIFAPIQYVQFLPRGSLSGRRNKIKIFPPAPEDFTDEFQHTKYGKSMMKYVAEIKATTTAVEIQRMERNVEDNLLKDIAGKDLFRKWIIDDKNLKKDFAKSYIDPKDSKKLRFPNGNPYLRPTQE